MLGKKYKSSHKRPRLRLSIMDAMYLCCIILSIVIVLSVGYNFAPDNSSSIRESVVPVRNGWTLTFSDGTTKQINLPDVLSDTTAGQPISLSAKLNHRANSDPTLLFRTGYVFVDVLMNGVSLYHYGTSNLPFGSIPVKSWHFVRLPSDFNEGELTIVLTPYLSNKLVLPDIVLGSRTASVYYIISHCWLTFILCLLIFFIGIIMIVAYFSLRINGTPGLNMLYIGLFAFVSAVWILSESTLINLFISNTYVIYYLSFLSFMLLPIPVLLFFKQTYHPKYGRLLDIFSALMMINLFVTTGFVVFNIADFKQTVLSSHILLVLSMMLLLFLIVNQLRKKRKDMRLVLVGIIFVLLIGILGVIFYYLFPQMDVSFVFPIVTLVLITTFGIDAMLIGFKMYTRTIEADTLEYLAYNDIMTNLKNRGAFEKRLNQLQTQIEDGTQNIGLVIIDINNLKNTNDTLGHQIGDELLIRCAKSITESFVGVATVYRIGGDEFCALAENKSPSQVKRCVNELDRRLESISEETGVPHSLSLGDCFFDRKIDKDLISLFRRADKEMYKCKVRQNSFLRHSSNHVPH